MTRLSPSTIRYIKLGAGGAVACSPNRLLEEIPTALSHDE
jgi:hypothetical protein